MSSNLLFIRYKKSEGIPEGGEVCTWRNYTALSDLLGEDNIKTYYVHEQIKKKSLWTIIKSGILSLFGYFYGLSPKRVKDIVSIAKSYDYVFIDRSVFGIIARDLKKSGYKGKIITFFHNVEVPYFEAKLANKGLSRFFAVKCADSNDRFSCLHSDRIIVLNERDGQEIKSRYGRTADSTIPIALADKFTDSERTDANTSPVPICMFLGSYFKPNNDGIIWFVRNVLPSVKIKMKIVKAAVKFYDLDNDYAPIIIEARRHCDAYELAAKLTMNYDRNNVVEGFVTDTDEFVNRIEAKKIAVDANQLIVPIEETYNELYSEDVW